MAQARLDLGRVQTFQALTVLSFRLLWSAGLFWYVNIMIEMVVLAWLILELTDSASQVALIGVCRLFPMFLVGLVGGSLADRFPKKRVMVGIQTVNVLVTAVMTVLIVTRAIQPWHVFLASLLMGTAWAVDFSTRRSYFAELVGTERLVNAISLDTAAFTGANMVGPILGGALIPVVSFGGAYALMLLFYLAGFALLLMMRPPEASRPSAPAGNVLDQVVEAMRTLRSNRILWVAFVVTVAMNFFCFPYFQMVPVIARDELGVGSLGYGILAAAGGLGSLISSLAIASREVRRKGLLFSTGSLVVLVAVILFALSPLYSLSMVLLFVGGLAATGFGAMQSVIALEAVAPDKRGRAMGIIALGIGASPLGLWITGNLAEAFGPRAAVAAMAGTGLLVLLALRWRFAELRG